MKPFARDPFSLMTFHRVLIGTMVAACIFFGGWQLYYQYATQPAGAIVRAIIAWVIAIGLVVYLVRIRGKR
jgi:hypothetical protein